MERAILREKQIKKWRRAWKLDLIEQANPDWHDLAAKLGFEMIGRLDSRVRGNDGEGCGPLPTPFAPSIGPFSLSKAALLRSKFLHATLPPYSAGTNRNTPAIRASPLSLG